MERDLIEWIRLTSEIAAYGTGILVLIFTARTFYNDLTLKQFESLVRVEEKYSALLKEAYHIQQLNQTWSYEAHYPRLKQLIERNTPTPSRWPFWSSLENFSDDPQGDLACYRMTREMLDILEQAFILQDKGWSVPSQVKQKWRSQMEDIVASNPYLEFVLNDLDGWYTASFAAEIKTLLSEARAKSSAALEPQPDTAGANPPAKKSQKAA